MTRIESADILKGILDQYGDEFMLKVLIRDYEDKIQAYKGSGDRVVISWHDRAVKCKETLESLLPAKVAPIERDYFDHDAFMSGAKAE